MAFVYPVKQGAAGWSCPPTPRRSTLLGRHRYSGSDTGTIRENKATLLITFHSAYLTQLCTHTANTHKLIDVIVSKQY